MDDERQRQAASLAYFDVFWLLAIVAILLIPIVLFITPFGVPQSMAPCEGGVGADHLKITDHSWSDTQTLAPLGAATRIRGKIQVEVKEIK